MLYSGGNLMRVEQRGRIDSLDLLATRLLMQSRVLLAFWAASAHYHLMSNFSSTSIPKVLLRRAALSQFTMQSILLPAIALTQGQDLTLGLVEVFEVHIGPLLNPVKVPLGRIPSR